MRRSVREAIVGFSLVGAIVSAVGFSFWLRGLSLTRQFWTLNASFQQASGLAARSPVVYRGVMVGSVRSVRVTPGAVEADLEITDPSLRLSLPVRAEVVQGSLLGGEAQVALISTGPAPNASAPPPRSPDCPREQMLCDGSSIKGSEAASLSTVTNLMQQLLEQGDREQLIQKLAGVAISVDQTSKQATAFLKDGQVLVGQGESLVNSLDRSVQDAQPTIANLNASSAHLRRLIAALDNPKTVAELQRTVSNAEQLTARWDAVGGDVNQLTSDPRFMDGLRNVTVGLGKFFEELYPAQTGAAREPAADAASGGDKARNGQATQRRSIAPGQAPEAFPMPTPR